MKGRDMQSKYLHLLKVMSKSALKCWSSEALSKEIGTSTRTIIRYIKEMKAEEKEGGFVIHSCKGRGYQLGITDTERFRALWAGKEDEGVSLVLFRLLLERTCKLDDLAELFHYSRSGMSRIMEKVEKQVEGQGLRLLSKPYVGFLISGNEICIRNYLYQLVESKNLDEAIHCLKLKMGAIKEIRDFLELELGGKGVGIDKSCELFFLKYLGVQLARLRIGHAIRTDYFANISNREHLRQDMEVAHRIAEIYNMAADKKEHSEIGHFEKEQSEIEEIYLALVYRQAFWQNGIVDSVDERNLQFYQEIVERALCRIRMNYNLDLFQDEILINGLILHIASNFRRYLLGMESENLFYNSVLEVYPTAYYYAMETAEEISGYTKLSLSKYEISFLGMHFASHLERNFKKKKWTAAIICGSGFGTARLLESKLLNKYASLNIIGVFSLAEIKDEVIEVELYISTVPLTEQEAKGKPWVQVSPLLKLEEQSALENMFWKLKDKKQWKEKGVKKYYVGMSRKMEKQPLLAYLCEWCEERGLMSKDESKGIRTREELVSTEIIEGIAMPHGLIEGDSFLVFAILPFPVMWGRTKVKIIILGCFGCGDERMKVELKFLFRLFLNDEARKEMLGCKDVKQLEGYVEAYYGE